MGSSKLEPSDDSDDATKMMDIHTEKTVADGEDCPPMLDSSPFEENEKVIVFHNSFLYTAKVEKVDYQMNKWKYYVHYYGWKKNWDEWVGVDRLMKHTEENTKRQQLLINQKQDIEKNLKSGRGHMKPKGSKVAMGKKRKHESLNKEKGSITLEHVVNLQIPPTLKKQLVDDCESITHLGKLVKLPRSPNVDEILNKYCDYRSKKDGLRANSTEEIVKGLQCYFDKALPVMLLYKTEREQYEDAVAVGHSPSTIYGAEHLLRLFVKLPELLVHIKIEEETLKELQQKLVEFLKFLQKNQSAFFLSTYPVPEDVETSTNKQDD
ncbi:hypothetical protein LWI28_016333 [Acer negundo]|uniref:MRG domain-containing protein n=1 Tax=Acer negundo TaxID=4023 RepID=A0AAD5P7B4_ACENE|nr:hypothetical protein LWI28_016333 [Acer negundo]KAK4860177.1 hypothetical protein QYF36_018746 [Acer negundo]